MEYQKLPDLTGLATLRAVVEKGGVNEAARRMHVSQSAVTKRLRTLDDCYGLPLMERIGGRLRLTQAGEKVYMAAVLMLDHHLALCEELTALLRGASSLRLEVTFAIGEHLLPDQLLSFNEQYPDYEIISRLAYSRQIQTDLVTGWADMALMEIAPDHPDILVQKWRDDELWLVCSSRHPLAETDLLPIEELGKQQYVLREKRSSIRESLEPALRGIGIEQLNIVLEVGSSEAIIDILERGKHVSFMPRFSVYERVTKGELVHVKVQGFRIMRTLWIARNRAALDHPVAEAFIGVIRD